MIRYTTPIIPMTVDADLTGFTIKVSFTQGSQKVTKVVTEIEVEDDVTSFSVPLTQQESGKFSATSQVQVQVNAIDANGTRLATDIEMINIFENLLPEVLSYGG